MTIFSNYFGGHGPFGPPWLRLCFGSPSDIFCVRHWTQATPWVCPWSQLVTGCEQAEVEVTPSQNPPLHSKTALTSYKTRQHWANSKGNYEMK